MSHQKQFLRKAALPNSESSVAVPVCGRTEKSKDRSRLPDAASEWSSLHRTDGRSHSSLRSCRQKYPGSEKHCPCNGSQSRRSDPCGAESGRGFAVPILSLCRPSRTESAESSNFRVSARRTKSCQAVQVPDRKDPDRQTGADSAPASQVRVSLRDWNPGREDWRVYRFRERSRTSNKIRYMDWTIHLRIPYTLPVYN